MFKQYEISSFRHRNLLPNRWDLVALVMVILLLVSMTWVAKQMTMPYQVGDPLAITLDPHHLPGYALRTILRMLLGMVFSLIFTLTIGTLAAKNRYAEQIIIPLIDILQSVPVLGFLSLTIVGFIALFRGSLLGPECAAIFAIFVGQVWNMTLSFYQQLRMLPPELKEVGTIFQLSAWQSFWRIEVPYAIPALLWNSMMSMSGSWFYVVAAEAISVSQQNINLPGIGSFISLAIKTANTQAVIYAIGTMLIVIILYDQLLFRPLLCWAEKFRPIEDTPQEEENSWVVNLLVRTRAARRLFKYFNIVGEWILLLGKKRSSNFQRKPEKNEPSNFYFQIFWYLMLATTLGIGCFLLANFLYQAFTLKEIAHVFFLGAITSFRVFILISLCSLIWIPIGVAIGMHPSLRRFLQPFIQMLAAFPANLLFPFVVSMIALHHLNVEIWTTPLMVLGAQWYILFNVVAGAAALPQDLYLVTQNLGVKGWLWWRSFILPGIFPYYITGAITAAGGAWNASIVAEVVTWGNTTFVATGLGAYITQYTSLGAFAQIMLGISVMCFYVLIFNRIIWRPLYDLAQNRFQVQ